MTKLARCDARATPQPPRRRRSHRGGSQTVKQSNSQTAKQPNSQTAKQPNSQTAKQPNSQTAKQPNSQTAARAIAVLGPACAARGACARETGPSEAMARMDVRSLIPSVCAEERSGQRIRARDCLSETPLDASTAGCPVAQRRGRRQRGRFLFGDFLSAGDPVARQEKVTAPPGALPGSRTWNKHAAQSAHRQVIWIGL